MDATSKEAQKLRAKEFIAALKIPYGKADDYSKILGYENAASFAQAKRGFVALNDLAIDLANEHFNADKEWLRSGKGQMFINGEIKNPFKNNPPFQPEEQQIKTTIQPVVIDADDKEYITYVPIPAQAGFAREYPRMDFVQRLPHFNIPGYHNGAALAFSVEGDSMSPTLRPNNIVIAEPVEKPEWIDPKGIHVVIADRGTLIKRFIYHKNIEFPADSFLEWISDNDFYNHLPIHQRSVPLIEVRHIFKVVMKIGRDMPAPDETLKLIKEILTKVDAIARRDINI